MSPLTFHTPSPEFFPELRSDPRITTLVLPDVPRFRCPHCQAVTTFVAYYPQEPDPELPERVAFDKASRVLRAQGCAHRDFFCRGCGRSVRVVYGAIEFAMSSYLFIPRQVLIGTAVPAPGGGRP